MILSLDLPDEVARCLGSTPREQIRHAQAAVAMELYRTGRISLRAMGELAGVGNDFWAADRFRIEHGLPLVTGTEEDDGPALELLRRRA